MMIARKRILISMIALFMFAVAVGCGKKTTTEIELGGVETDETEDTESEDTESEDNSDIAGYDTPDELIYAYIDFLNGSVSAKELCDKGFDENGYYAFCMVENCRAIDTFDEAYEVVNSIDKGADYINSNCKKFAEKWEMEYGHSITEEEVANLRNEYGGEYGESMCDLARELQEILSDFAPYERSIIEENKWQGDYGIKSYRIYVNDPNQIIQSANIDYVYVNGRYYWVLVNRTE